MIARRPLLFSFGATSAPAAGSIDPDYPGHPEWLRYRTIQSLFYPEYLPDVARPLGLPWSSVGDRIGGVSESFSTLRYGRLAEILLYDIRRTRRSPARARFTSISK